MEQFLTTHYIEIINGLMALFTGGYWLKAKLDKIKLKSASADATKKIVDLYQDAIDDLEKRYKERYDELEKFYKNRIENMRDSIRKELRAEMEAELEELRKEVKSLRTNLELWKTKYRNLKEAFEQYRQKHGDK
jgi:uncharacterized protein YydD (DUF2326 family)